jgi:hypothetical protein
MVQMQQRLGNHDLQQEIENDEDEYTNYQEDENNNMSKIKKHMTLVWIGLLFIPQILFYSTFSSFFLNSSAMGRQFYRDKLNVDWKTNKPTNTSAINVTESEIEYGLSKIQHLDTQLKLGHKKIEKIGGKV